MKQLIVLFFTLVLSFNLYANEEVPEIDLNALSVVKLNSLKVNKAKFYAYTSGAYSAGICRLIIRSVSSVPSAWELAQRFKFSHAATGEPNAEVTPLVTDYAIIFKLRSTDYSFENITVETKDGLSIAENVAAIFGRKAVAVMLGTCYSRR